MFIQGAITYTKICEKFDVKAEDILFLSAYEDELDAAASVGVKCVRVVRQDQIPSTKYSVVEQLDKMTFREMTKSNPGTGTLSFLSSVPPSGTQSLQPPSMSKLRSPSPTLLIKDTKVMKSNSSKIRKSNKSQGDVVVRSVLAVITRNKVNKSLN